MHPELFAGVRAYPIFVAAGIGLGILVAAFTASRTGLPWRSYLCIQAILTIAGVLGAKIYALIEQGTIASFSWEATRGYRYPGGIIAVLSALPLARSIAAPQLSLLALADAFAPAIGFAMAIIRVGCFLNGCCFGTVLEGPWAFVFPKGSPAWAGQIAAQLAPSEALYSLPVHPLQLYFAVLSLGIGVFLLWFGKRKACKRPTNTV